MNCMYYPSREKFIELSRSGNVIPVYKEILADFDTPLSAFVKVAKDEYSFLFESVEGGERMARYSFLGNSPSVVISSRGDEVSITKGEEVNTFKCERDPIDEVKRFMRDFNFVPVEGLPRFCGGLVGYIGYDMVRFFENIPDTNPETIGMPEMQLVLTDTILIFDHVDHKIKVVSNAIIEGSAEEAYDAAIHKIDKLTDQLEQEFKPPDFGEIKKASPDKIASNFSKEEFAGAVEKVKEYIKQGEIIQLVLSQRFSRETEADSFNIYRALRSINPSPYMYYLKLGEDRIIGSSPEILFRCEDGKVQVRPIAGTRRRGKDQEEDRELEKDLLKDPKERAEHIMLVDLGRNDIGRVCKYGTVKPRELMTIERYSHVMHIVSDVVGRIDENKDIYDLIRGAFPAGTVSGAPKVRAMTLIDEMEKERRGVYAGSVGYISFSGNMDMCISIRTIVMQKTKAYIQAGAGIVLDSIGEKEYEETQNKAKAMIKAIEMAEEGLL